MKTSRQLVLDTLEFKNTGRAPRDLWVLPWASTRYGKELEEIRENYSGDFGGTHGFIPNPPKTYGDAYKIGTYIDEWGCKFENKQEGVIGEVKEPIVLGEDWEDADNVHIPYELLEINIEKINEYCKSTDLFVTCGACPRPFEQLQFIRGTAELYIDIALENEGMMEFIEKMHKFYCDLLTAWAKTDVDCLNIMDDWGSQRALLINPVSWRKIFKPLYKDYADIAHKHGKKLFMHSDGYILEIIPDLIEIGIDALNSQVFCMGIENLEQFKGKITFWGEIDRQNLLPNGSVEDIDNAVESVYNTLWNNGGCIAQCEFGPGANPRNVHEVYKKWDELTNK